MVLFFPPGLMRRSGGGGGGGGAPPTITRLGTGMTGSSTATTTPFTPAANSLLIAVAQYRRGGSSVAPDIAGMSTPAGLTWGLVADNLRSGAVPGIRATAYAATAPPSPTQISVGMTSANGGNFFTSVYEILGADHTDFANVGGDTDAAGDPNPVLANTPLGDSLILAAASVALTENATPPPTFLDTPAGFTDLWNVTRAINVSVNPLAGQVCYRVPSDVNQAAWVSAGFTAASIILEIKRA